MPDFGTINRERDLFAKVESLDKALNFILNEMKHYFQKSSAQVISRHGAEYTVFIPREDKTVSATLSEDVVYWRSVGIPRVGDTVKIEHVKDLFHVKITEKERDFKFADGIVRKNTISSTKGKM